jgi:predicted nucleotidyltransferase
MSQGRGSAAGLALRRTVATPPTRARLCPRARACFKSATRVAAARVAHGRLSSMPLSPRQALIEEIQPVLAGTGQVRLALLFGSCARQQAHGNSDVDIAVDAPGADLWSLAARVSERVGAEVDVIALASASIPLLEQLIAEGLVIHESEPGRGAAWRSRALAQLETDRPWYRRMRDAWLRRVAQGGLSGGQ